MENATWGNGPDETREEVSFYILKEGMTHTDIIDFKKKLKWLNYGKIKVTPYFGSYLKKQVEKFQSDYNMLIHGMIDRPTKEMIDESFLEIFRPESDRNKFHEFLQVLSDIGFPKSNEAQACKYEMEEVVREFQAHYKLPAIGQVDFKTLNKLDEILGSSLQLGNRHRDIIKLKENLNAIGYGRLKITNKFGSATESKLKKFQGDYGLPVSGIADEMTLEKIAKALKVREKLTYTRYEQSLDEVLESEEKINISNDAEDVDAKVFFNPNKLINDVKKKYLFLDLFRPNVVSAPILNQFLIGKGVLEGTGQAFIDAGKETGINELFLLSHALYGDGLFPLSTVSPVNKKGDPTFNARKENGQIIKVPGITDRTEKILFNIYGINDEKTSSAVKQAFEEDWVTAEKAIKEGAKAIKQQYDTNYNTLYKMYGIVLDKYKDKQATYIADINWTESQLDSLYRIYEQLESYTLYLEIPVYKNQPIKKYIRG